MKIYVIQIGEYSEKRVVCVADSEDNAKKICEMIKNRTSGCYHDSIWYDVFDTNQFQINGFRFYVKFYCGEWSVELDCDPLPDETEESYELYENNYVVYAQTPEQAIKIAQDMRARIEAEKEGIT